MAIRSKQVGQSAEANLLYEILKAINKLTKVVAAGNTSSTTTSTTTTP